MTRPPFSYNPTLLPREKKRHYICASDSDLKEMEKSLSLSKLEDVFSHLPSKILFDKPMGVDAELSYEELAQHLFELSEKNHVRPSFIGDGLKNYQVSPIVSYVASLRGLTTAYTPYQPERSQGTLTTLWMYASSLSMLTGFEAINASMYDRASCLFEAVETAERLQDGAPVALVCATVDPEDIRVLKTLAKHTPTQIEVIPLDKKSGRMEVSVVKEYLAKNAGKVASLTFSQVNSLGNLELVDELTDLCAEFKVKAIAVIDPMLLSKGGLKAPAHFGKNRQGADLIVGEGQHLAIAPNYGGPGLGIFGIRFNETDRVSIRQTAGRFVGKTVDAQGRSALCMVLSTREQHIRREKATSNICSNQSFVATLAGAAILARGEKGMSASRQHGLDLAKKMAEKLTAHKGVSLAFAQTPFYNEFTLRLPVPSQKLIEEARLKGLHLGVDVSARTGDSHDLLISFFDVHTEKELALLENFFTQTFGTPAQKASSAPVIPATLLRAEGPGLPNFSLDELKAFYQKLAQQNVSPDDNIYPLGSCTMKYNPYINDWAAGLKGFTDLHPQAPDAEAQGSLELLWRIQENFKKITGLHAVTTQPVAGAQGELVGLKLFQAYHQDHGGERDIILIPRSAHGTNPATASMAGYETSVIDGKKHGIVIIEASDTGEINFDQLQSYVREFGSRIAGIMVTNPNTAGVFENRFHEVAELIHSVGGLVYMDGANMNAIAGIVDLGKLGVDAVHNNLHKTWTIPHGGGGPGDAIVAVSARLTDYLPGIQVEKRGDQFVSVTPKKCIGSFHRHVGNFAHKVRAYAYLRALGEEGIKNMSSVAVLSAQYLYKKLATLYPTLPAGAHEMPRMHEFILTIPPELFLKIDKSGTPRAQVIAKIGKLFLDFGLHAPTVAFPEQYGLMIEPTESFTKAELDRFTEVVEAIYKLINEHPEVLTTVPHFTPVDKIDEVKANKDLILAEKISALPQVLENRVSPEKLGKMSVGAICEEILSAHRKRKS